MKEEKRIKLSIWYSIRELIIKNRDWLLGGQGFDWEYYVDKSSNELVLRRW